MSQISLTLFKGISGFFKFLVTVLFYLAKTSTGRTFTTLKFWIYGLQFVFVRIFLIFIGFYNLYV